MIPTIFTRVSFLLTVSAGIIACSPNGVERPEQVVQAELFSPDSVCEYAANGPNPIFRSLGGGRWGTADERAPAALYECLGSAPVVQLFGDGSSTVQVEYAAVGVEGGASMIALNYLVNGARPVPNESTYRNVFVNLADNVAKDGLKQPMPELFRRKLSNLKSYYALGKGSDENFDVGNGFVLLNREASADGLTIKVAVKFYPDVAFRLKT